MEQSLNLLLDDINKASDGLSSQYFKPPGIFHNAIVKHLTTNSVMDFTKILRDTKDSESSMFKIEKNTVKRKDGKEGIFDFLTEKQLRQRRSRNLGIHDPKPIIQIPRKFYLEQQRLELSNSVEIESLRGFYTPMNTTTATSQHSQLLARFQANQEATDLLISLFQGSVIIEDNIPMEVIINILNEINKLWPGAEFSEKQNDLARQYSRLKELKDKLDKDVEQQEAKIMERSAGDIQQLLEEKKRELADLERHIEEKKESKIVE